GVSAQARSFGSKARYMPSVKALSACGRFKVTVATPPVSANRMSSVLDISGPMRSQRRNDAANPFEEGLPRRRSRTVHIVMRQIKRAHTGAAHRLQRLH